MAEATTEKPPLKDSPKRILNRSTANKTYHLRDGRMLKPGEVADVSAEEYKSLVTYRDLIDADKLSPAKTRQHEALLKENAELKAQIEALKVELEASQEAAQEAADEKPEKKGKK